MSWGAACATPSHTEPRSRAQLPPRIDTSESTQVAKCICSEASQVEKVVMESRST